MSNQVYLGADLGAESGRVMAGVWDGKRMTLEEVHRFPNEPVEIGDSFRWDVARLWREIQTGLGLAGKKFGKQIVSVGVDTWGVDHVLLSKSSEILGLPFHYRDKRTRGMLQKALGKVSREEIFANSGLQFMEINTLYQLLALQRDHPELLAAADCLLMMPDFLHWCLSGARVAEFTDATTTQFFHPTKRTWSVELLQKFGLPTNFLPEVVMPGTRLGSLRLSVAEKTGLERVAVVAPGSHDTASAVAAVPADKKAGWAYISSGTWSLMGVELPQAQLSPRVLELDLTNEGGVDGTYRLLKNIMGLWLVQQCRRSFAALGKDLKYEELTHLATTEPALRSQVNPNDPRFLNPQDMPTAIQEFCIETGQPVPSRHGAFVRCALESLALMYAWTLSALEEITGQRIEVIHIVGGGSQNYLLNQFTANACDRTVLAGPVEATILGNLLVQARAFNEVTSLEQLRGIVRGSSELQQFNPEPSSKQAWQDAKGKFAELIRPKK